MLYISSELGEFAKTSEEKEVGTSVASIMEAAPEDPIKRIDSFTGPLNPPAIQGIRFDGSEIPKLVAEIVLVNTTDDAL